MWPLVKPISPPKQKHQYIFLHRFLSAATLQILSKSSNELRSRFLSFRSDMRVWYKLDWCLPSLFFSVLVTANFSDRSAGDCVSLRNTWPNMVHLIRLTFSDNFSLISHLLYSSSFVILPWGQNTFSIRRRCLRCAMSICSKMCCGAAQLLQLYIITETTSVQYNLSLVFSGMFELTLEPTLLIFRERGVT